ncbi:MAG TPA: selenide, water dikinase SelD [Luteimonas sp.]
MSATPDAPAGATAPPRLTSLSHGGGCGCKIAPGVLAELLKRAAPAPVWPQLMVGNDTSDDAAVYRLNDQQALIATTDFFMPIVDDPYDFGRIAATNALSDVYAMGGTPVVALAIVGMPVNVLPHAVIAEILRGGEDACAAAGIPVAGGHSIDSVEPIYGLAAMGLAHPDRIRRNADARAGDLLVLGKPLGVGVLSAALKRGVLDDAGYRAMVDATTRLNTPGVALAALPDVHAMTDVTGFGLLGHALELARGADLTVRLRFDDLPWLPGVRALAAEGVVTGASGRNWAAYGDSVQLAPVIDKPARDLLTDPQTSGGLLVSCAPAALGEVLDAFQREGFAEAVVVGELRAGAARVEVG